MISKTVLLLCFFLVSVYWMGETEALASSNDNVNTGGQRSSKKVYLLPASSSLSINSLIFHGFNMRSIYVP